MDESSRDSITQAGRAGRDLVVSVIRFLPNASAVKNYMTAYTLVIVLFSMIFAFLLLYTNNGLLPVITKLACLKQPVYVYVIAFNLLVTYCNNYELIAEGMSFRKDSVLRGQVLFPPCLIFTSIMIVYVRGDDVGLIEAIISMILGRQMYNVFAVAFNLYFSISNGPSDNNYAAFHFDNGKFGFRKILNYYVSFIFIQFVMNILQISFLVVVIIPISLSFLNLDELERFSIYGIAFPILRYIYGNLTDYFISLLDNKGQFNQNPQGRTNIKFITILSCAMYFTVSPLFCMLYLSPDPLTFAITYIPHACINKLLWFRKIPQVKAVFARITHRIRCNVCLGRQTVLPLQETNLAETTANNVLSAQDIIRMEQEERERIEQQKKNISISAGTQEVADLIANMMTVMIMLMHLFGLCFLQHSGNGTSSSFSDSFQDQFVKLLICVFCVIIPIDQLTALLGFALLSQNGFPVDANLNLDINTWNPIRTFKSGHHFRAFGGLSYCVCTLLAFCCAFAVGANGPLF